MGRIYTHVKRKPYTILMSFYCNRDLHNLFQNVFDNVLTALLYEKCHVKSTRFHVFTNTNRVVFNDNNVLIVTQYVVQVLNPFQSQFST